MSRTFVLTSLVAVLAVSAAAQDQPVPPPVKPAEPKIERRMANSVERLAVSPDGKWLAASDERGAVMMFSTETDEARVVVPAGPARKEGQSPTEFQQLIFTADGTVLVAVPAGYHDAPQLIRFISVADGKEIRAFDASTERDPKSRESSGGGRVLEVGIEPGGAKVRLLRMSAIEIWDTATGERVESRKNEPFTQQFVRSKDGALTACGAWTKLWLTATGEERWAIDLDRVAMSGKKVSTKWSGNCIVLGFTIDTRLLVVLSRVSEIKDPETLTGDDLDKRTKKTTQLEGRFISSGKVLWRRDVSASVSLFNAFVAANTVALFDDGVLSLFDATNGEPREKVPPIAKYTCGAATSDGLTFWAGTADGQVVKVKAPKGK